MVNLRYQQEGCVAAIASIHHHIHLMCLFGQEEKKQRENVHIHYKEIFQRDNRMLENGDILESCESVKSLTFDFFVLLVLL